jgi:hypothetical protein
MLIKDYLSQDFPMLSPNDGADKALALLHQFGFSHIFVSEDQHYLGALSKAHLQDNLGKNLGDLRSSFTRFALSQDSNMVDVLKLFNLLKCNVLPVLDAQEHYLGSIAVQNLMAEYAQYPMFAEIGAMLTVEISQKGYGMTEIAKIVESHNNKFYGAFISHMDQDWVQITMKISPENLSSITQTFVRFGYRVVQKYYADQQEELIKDRLDFLNKFMEI